MTNEETPVQETEKIKNNNEPVGTTGTSEPQPRRTTSTASQPRRPSTQRFHPRRKVCSFCVDRVNTIDYKDVDTLRRFLDDHAKIKARRKTGTCAKHQRRLAVAIKRARHLALLPFTSGRFPYTE